MVGLPVEGPRNPAASHNSHNNSDGGYLRNAHSQLRSRTHARRSGQLFSSCYSAEMTEHVVVLGAPVRRPRARNWVIRIGSRQGSHHAHRQERCVHVRLFQARHHVRSTSSPPRYGTPIDEITKPGVEFRQETITSIHAERRRVSWTDVATYDADILVVALGADYDVAAYAGTARRRVRVLFAHRCRSVPATHWPVSGVAPPSSACSARSSSVLGRRTRPHCSSTTISCPAWIAVNSSTIHLVSPMPMPIPISKKNLGGDRDDSQGTRHRISGPQRGWPGSMPSITSHISTMGASCPMTYSWGSRSTAPLPSSSLPILPKTDGSPVDPATFATKFPGVFAVGDVTSAPVPRAGGIAEGEAATVAKVLISQLTGGSVPPPYDGASGCYVELGDDLGGAHRRRFSLLRHTGREVQRTHCCAGRR